MLGTLADCFRVPDLRRRLIITIALLAICRIGVFVPVPGVDPVEIQKRMWQGGERGLMTFMSIFSGGALERMAIFGLNVMPYISASIIFQLLVQVIPSLKKIAEEGESGRQKINQYTRYATVLLCFFQAYMMISAAKANKDTADIFGIGFGAGMIMLAALLMTCGSLLLMWIGEQIDEYGIGNGISLLIMSNIVARLPVAILILWNEIHTALGKSSSDIVWQLVKVGFLLAAFVFVVYAITFITQGQRRIPFQQAKQMRGRRMYGGMKHYLPLQVNAANVIPIIFASSLLMFPAAGVAALSRRMAEGEGFLKGMVNALNLALTPGNFVYLMMYVVLIFFFCYFWTAITFNPTDMAKHLQENGSFIPGIRPGRRTSEYLERVMSRITLPGAASLAVIAIIPTLLGGAMKISWYVTEFFGGTTILIAVGVGLDLIRKVEAQLLIRHYEGFTRGARRRF